MKPLAYGIPTIRLINRWVVVVYFSIIHPILLLRRFANGGITYWTWFWIGMAVFVLVLYIPQVIRDMRQVIKMEFDGPIVTLIYLTRQSKILPIPEIQAISKGKNKVLIKTDQETIELSDQINPNGFNLLSKLREHTQ